MSKIAIITGASRGIGKATAIMAAQAGYDICINYASDEESAEIVRSECEGFGRKATTFKADISVRSDVTAMFAHCLETLGAPTLLVNNAGIIGKASLLRDLSAEELEETFKVNVFGAIYCCQEAIQRMSKSSGGRGGVIINISSIAAELGSPNEYVHYAASKGAIETLTIGLAKEVGPEGIRVNAVRSGTINTTIHQRSGNPDRPAMVAKVAPLRRVGVPEDIANAVVWLASEKAGFATGSILKISGGL